MTAGLLALAICMPSQDGMAWKSNWGTLSTEFKVPEGVITLYLPQDTRAGDTVSGSVTPLINGYTVEAEGAHSSTDDGTLTFRVPDGANSVPVALKDGQGNAVARIVAPLRTGERTSEASFKAAPAVQEGGAIYVSGPFDGNRRNTSVRYDGQPAGILAETPRNCVISTALGDLGPHRLSILERSNIAETQVNHVQLRLLTPPKINRGRRADVNLQLRGLRNMPEASYPLELQLQILDPNIADFPEQSPQVVRVNHADVKGDTWTMKIPVQGHRRGEYRMSGYVYSPGFPYTSGY